MRIRLAFIVVSSFLLRAFPAQIIGFLFSLIERLRPMSRGYGVTGLEPLSYGESAMPSKPVSSPESFQAFDLVQSSK
jgi:hypothetical protein